MKKNMTFSADFVKSGYTKVSRQAMQVAFTPGNKCEKEAKVLLCILSFAHFRRGMVCVHFKDYVCERGEWISSYSELAFRTGMARKTVVTAVERLVEDGSLTVTPMGKKDKVYVDLLRCASRAGSGELAKRRQWRRNIPFCGALYVSERGGL